MTADDVALEHLDALAVALGDAVVNLHVVAHVEVREILLDLLLFDSANDVHVLFLLYVQGYLVRVVCGKTRLDSIPPDRTRCKGQYPPAPTNLRRVPRKQHTRGQDSQRMRQNPAVPSARSARAARRTRRRPRRTTEAISSSRRPRPPPSAATSGAAAGHRPASNMPGARRSFATERGERGRRDEPERAAHGIGQLLALEQEERQRAAGEHGERAAREDDPEFGPRHGRTSSAGAAPVVATALAADGALAATPAPSRSPTAKPCPRGPTERAPPPRSVEQACPLRSASCTRASRGVPSQDAPPSVARTASDAPPFAGPRRADDTAKAAATPASAPTRMAGPESPAACTGTRPPWRRPRPPRSPRSPSECTEAQMKMAGHRERGDGERDAHGVAHQHARHVRRAHELCEKRFTAVALSTDQPPCSNRPAFTP